jgi:hypothetical protein
MKVKKVFKNIQNRQFGQFPRWFRKQQMHRLIQMLRQNKSHKLLTKVEPDTRVRKVLGKVSLSRLQ